MNGTTCVDLWSLFWTVAPTCRLERKDGSQWSALRPVGRGHVFRVCVRMRSCIDANAAQARAP